MASARLPHIYPITPYCNYLKNPKYKVTLNGCQKNVVKMQLILCFFILLAFCKQ